MKVFTIVHGSFLFIVSLRFDAIALNLKPSTSNIKLSTSNSKKRMSHYAVFRFLLNAISSFCAQRLYQYPYFVLPSIVVSRNRKSVKALSLRAFFIIMGV